MKRSFVLLSMYLCLCLSGSMAQVVINIPNLSEGMKAEPIDDLQFIVQYTLTSVPDTLKPEKTDLETMILKVGSKSAQYYSYNRFVTDSLFREEMRKSTDGRVMSRQSSDSNPGRQTAQLYKNYPAGKVTTLDHMASSRFLCEEKNELPQWELLPDTMTILSYPCQKAICTFKGRQWEAWFTTEIPRSEGPWKLQGLPGLILEANDNENHYRFVCTGIVRPREEEKIMFGADGYQPVSRKDLNIVYKRYAADPLGYVISTSPNMKIVMKGPDGQDMRPKDTPFNPIERE